MHRTDSRKTTVLILLLLIPVLHLAAANEGGIYISDSWNERYTLSLGESGRFAILKETFRDQKNIWQRFRTGLETEYGSWRNAGNGILLLFDDGTRMIVEPAIDRTGRLMLRTDEKDYVLKDLNGWDYRINGIEEGGYI